MFENKTLMVTGGTGSFGNTVAARFLESEPLKEIRIFSRDEKKQDDMRKKYNHPKLKFYLGDVRDPNSVQQAMEGVDFIFHAAALKQVPSCEFYPMQAVQTNVLGTENVINAAVRFGVQKMIVLSTDKAVYPINAMGMSKALMEKVAQARGRLLDRDNTVVNVTRYGNVMASRGSVIPLFIEQIKQGNPITITNPHMTRYLMSLDEAVELVLYAFRNGNQGDLFVQKAPASTIQDLATAILELFEAENEIHIIGTRHGEKLHETLLSSEERLMSVDEGDYFRLPVDDRDLNYAHYVESGTITEENIPDYTSGNTRRLTVDEVKEKLLTLPYVQAELEQMRLRKAESNS